MGKTKKNHKSGIGYNSKNGFLTTIWGPCIWTFLHTVSFNYPIEPTQEDKDHYRDFIMSLRHILPCGICRNNLKKNMKKLPLTAKDLESRESFSRYIFNLHELVNKMLHKKSGLTYEVVRERFENFRAHCSKARKTMKKKEIGCVTPYTGVKSKCLIKIVPQNDKSKTLTIDDHCLPKKEEK
jgi:hypothetical protein